MSAHHPHTDTKFRMTTTPLLLSFILLANKQAIGWAVVLIGLLLGATAVCFPHKRKSPTGEEEAAEAEKKKKKSRK